MIFFIFLHSNYFEFYTSVFITRFLRFINFYGEYDHVYKNYLKFSMKVIKF